MIRWLIIFLALPAAVFSEPVTIRSGEHETFSRLVLSIGVGNEWGVTPESGGYVLDISGVSDGFDTSTIFARIPRERLVAVAQRDVDSLFLSVECDCYVDTFLWQPGQLVLDVVDGPDPESPNVEPVETLMSPTQTPARPMQLPNLLALNSDPSTPSTALEIPLELQQSPTTSDLRETEEALITGLARAASQGFLNPAVKDVEETVTQEMSVVEVEEPEDMPGPPIVLGRPGIGISTAMDRELALLGDELESTLGDRCLPPDLFEISAWADGGALHEQIASLAEGLAGEFGEEPREAHDQLARLYIHFGFGSEARAVLSTDAALSQSRRVMSELAGIVDDYPGAYSLISAQSGCETPGALWAFLVDPEVLEEQQKNYILQQFFVLPQPLRGQISSRLSRKFLAVNDRDSASRILRAAENNDAEVSHDVQASRALIAEESDDPVGALAVLSSEAENNARTTPESLIRLINLALSQEQTPTEEDLILAATLREEYRGSPIAAELAVAEAAGWNGRGQYREALNLLDGRSDDSANRVVDDVFSRIAETATTAEFLEFAYADIPSAVLPQTENEMARRLIDVGFPERASAFRRGCSSSRRYGAS